MLVLVLAGRSQRVILVLLTAGLLSLLASLLFPPQTSLSTRRLARAIEDGDLGRVRELIEAGADLDGPIVKRSLMYFLLEGTWERHEPPLYLAVHEGEHEIVRALLRAGADANAATEPGGSTALSQAIHSRGWDARMLNTLLEAEPDPGRDRWLETRDPPPRGGASTTWFRRSTRTGFAGRSPMSEHWSGPSNPVRR